MSPDPPGGRPEMTGGWRAGLSRRSFLRRGTFTAATVAVASSVPGLSTLVAGATADAPVIDTGVSDVEMDSGLVSEPLVAHVKDLSTGEISLFQGEREVVVRSPDLARSLMSAARP
jgi:hypothetical protein